MNGLRGKKRCMRQTALCFGASFLIFNGTGFAAEQVSGKGAFNLDEIVVTGTKSEHTLQDTPVTTHLITKEEIKQSNAQTAGDVLRWVPGVYVKSNGFARDAVNIAGLPDKYTLVLIDGQRQTGRHANAVDLSNIPAEMIERIEVIKGPSSVLYGSDAVAGVINVITKKNVEKGYASGTASYGSGDTIDAQASFGDRQDKLSYAFGVGNHSSNQMGDGYEYDAKNMLSNFQYDLNPNNRLDLNLNAYNEKSDYLDDTKFNGGIGLESKFGESSNLKLKFTDHLADRKDIRPGQTPRDWDYDNKAGEVQYSQMATKHQLVTLGSEYRQNNLESTEVGKKEENTVSGFIQDEIDLFDSSLFLVLADRVDHHDMWGTESNPKGSIMYKFSETDKLRFNAGRAFLAPALDQLYRIQPHQHIAYWIIGNPDLQPETSVGYSVDLDHQWGKMLLGRVSLFRNDIDNMISSREVGIYSNGQPIMQSYNIKEAFSQGFEVELQYSPFKNLFGAIAYTYSETEDKAVNKQIQNMPNHTGKFRIQYNNDAYKYSAHYDMEYIGKMYTDSALKQQSRDYVIANAKLTKDVSEHVALFGAVNNIFNEVPAPQVSKYFDMDRLWTAGLTYKF